MTDEFIFHLSRHPPRRRRISPTVVLIGVSALSLAVASALSVLWLSPRDDLTAAIGNNHVFLLKFVFLLGINIPAMWIVRDLSIPGKGIRSPMFFGVILFILVIGLIGFKLANGNVGTFHNRSARALLECLWLIPILAALPFVILAGALRRLGPTDLRITGAFVGLLAGGIGAVAYALHCDHDSLVFVGIAYTAAILETALLGLLLGPRLLRWT